MCLYIKDEQGKQSLVTEFDQKIAERLYHLPNLEDNVCKISGEKQVILMNLKVCGKNS